MAALIAVDTETRLSWWDKPFLASTYDGTTGIAWELPTEAANLREYLDGACLVFHNAKFDLQKLIVGGILDRGSINPENIEDTEALAHLLDEHQVKRLKPLARKYLNEETDEDDRVREAKKAVAKEHKLKLGEITYDMLPREIIVPYAIKDAEYTYRLYELLKPQIDVIPDLSQLYRDEMVLCLVLLDMEAQAMKLDLNYLESRVKEYGTKSLLKELEIRDMVGREDFNPNSPKQILEAFDSLGLKLSATNKVALREVEHPLAAAILELRHLRKMHGTYLLGLKEEQRDGLIHPNFRQHRPVTGRMASGSREAD